MIGSSFSRD